MNIRLLKYSTFCLILSIFLSSCSAFRKPSPVQSDSTPQVDLAIVEMKDQKIHDLETEIARMAIQLAQLEKISTNLKRTILTKYQETDSCLQTNEKLLAELVQSKAKLLNRGTKLEAVTLVAETTARISSVTNQPLTDQKRAFVLRAQQYLKESGTEIEKRNYEAASYLSRKAAELVKLAELDKETENSLTEGIEISFSNPLRMVLIKNGNLRSAPSLEAEIKTILKAGSPVSATGYKHNWVKVKLDDQTDTGWIHLSLLKEHPFEN